MGGFDAVAGLQLVDGLGQVVADRAFAQMQPDRNIGNAGAASAGSSTRSPAMARRMAVAGSLAGAPLTRKPTTPLSMARRR